MRNPVLAALCFAAVGMLVLGPTFVLAQSYEAYQNIKGAKQGNTATSRLTVRKAGESPTEYLTTTQNSKTTGGGTGKVRYNDLSITKKLDQASPIFMNKPLGGSTGPTKPIIIPRDAASGLPTGKRQ
jgi:hypothetical protein